MRSFSIVVVSLFAGVALCGQASAEVGVPSGTVQQAAADALFLQYAPPSPTPGIVCLVDSGVDPNPRPEVIVTDVAHRHGSGTRKRSVP